MTMKTATALLGVILLATLAGCSKKSPTDEAAADKAAQPSAETKAMPPRKSHAEKAAGLLTLIDTAPQCQEFRDRLEAAGRTPDDQPLPVDSMSMIVAEAHKAGCSKKPGQQ
jgi:predicted small lipoprotein YifL